MVKSSEAAITAAESAEDQTKNTLFVRGIPFTATNEELETFFSEFGPLRSCFAVIDKEAAAVKKNVTNSASADSSNDAPKNR